MKTIECRLELQNGMNLTIHLIDFLHIDVCSPLEGLDVGTDVGLDVGADN